MKPILPVNRALLDGRFPGLAADSARAAATERTIRVERGPAGHLFGQAEGRDGKRLTLCSRHRPDQDADRLAARVPADAAACLVVGFGVGHLPRSVLRRLGPDARVHVVVCNPDVFLAVLAEADASDLLADPRLRLLAGREDVVLRGVAAVLRDDARVEVVVDRADVRACAEIAPGLHKLGERFTEGEDLVGEKANQIRDNYLANLPVVLRRPGIAALRDRYRGRPGVIVSAGPSLDRNRHLLPALRGKALVLGVEAAYPAFAAVGATPDLLVSVDSSRYNREHFTLIAAPVPLVLMPSIHPDIPRAHAGPQFVALPRGDRMAEFLDRELGKGLVESGASVTNAAAGIADYLGLDPIVFVGLDLSYPKGGASHAQGARWRRPAGIEDHAYRIEIPAADGGTCWTLPNFARYLRWLARFVASRPGTRFIDATEGGALKPGMERMPLAEAIARFGAGDVPAVPAVAGADPPDAAAREGFLAKVVAAFPEAKESLERRWGTADPYRLPSRYWDAGALLDW